MTLEKSCLLASSCKLAGNERFCNQTCFPHTRLHGENGDGGLLAIANIPTKYRTSTLETLPIQADNPRSYAIAQKFGATVYEKVQEGVGLYLYGVPNEANPKGTGTGKTTTAIALVIEYLRERVRMEAKGIRPIDGLPAYFVKMSKFQNVYNSMFRGSREKTEENADVFAALKKKMTTADLLVIDDVGLRGMTEALQNELYEIIDEREMNGKSTILTSNTPLSMMAEIVSEQVVSRIDGMAYQVSLGGVDHRKKEF